MKHRLAHWELARLLAILDRDEMKARTTPPVFAEIRADVARIVSQTAQDDTLVLDLRLARAKDDGMTTVSISEAASRLGVHRTTLRRQVNRGELDTVRVGRWDRIRVADLERLTERGGQS